VQLRGRERGGAHHVCWEIDVNDAASLLMFDAESDPRPFFDLCHTRTRRALSVGHIQKLERTRKDGTVCVRFQARYTAPDGTELTKTFERRRDAERFLAETVTDQARGQ
jgi:hypothetical protein